MGIKKFKPTTNGRRNMTGSDFAEITKTKPEKSLLVLNAYFTRGDLWMTRCFAIR